MASGDRGRDLKLTFLSDVDKLDLEKPARGLEGVADAADTAGRALDSLERSTADRTLSDLDDAAKDAGRSLDDLDRKVPTDQLDKLDRAAQDAGRSLRDAGDDASKSDRELEDYGRTASTVADKVETAFRDIARASSKSARDVDDDLDKAKRGLDEFKSEAAGSGREAAASFGGGFDDVTSFIQETAANAFAGFGAIGAVAGTAAALGLGVITKFFDDTKERTEEAKGRINDYVQAFVDGQGRIQEAAIQTNLQALFGDSEKYRELSTNAREAGVSIELLARAKAGDASAAKEVSARVAALTKELDANQVRTTESEAATLRQSNALKRVSQDLGITTGELSTAESAWRDLDRATRAGITANVDTKVPTRGELQREHQAMQRELGRGINTPVSVTGAQRAAAVARAEADDYFRRHPITIRTVPGARPIRDIP